MQDYLDIHEPLWRWGAGERGTRLTREVRHDSYVHPGVECEIAVRLAADLLVEQRRSRRSR